MKTLYRSPQNHLKRGFGPARGSWQVQCQQADPEVSVKSFLLTINPTLSVAIVRGTSSPRTSFRKILLKDKSIMRESSIALATNCPMTRSMCVLFLCKSMLITGFRRI